MVTDRLFLVGMMGAGKTTVGRVLADWLGWQHLDSDRQVEEATGRSVPEILAVRGEPAFRAEEADALARAATSVDPVVVSVAGGAVLDAGNQRLLSRCGTVVWLRARTDTLAGRVGSGDGRPLLGDEPAAALCRLEAQRRPVYRQLAQVVVDVDDLDPTQVAERILDGLSRARSGVDAGGRVEGGA